MNTTAAPASGGGTPLNDPVRKLIRDRLAELRLSESAVSTQAGFNPAYLNQFLKRGVPKELPELQRERFAAILQINPDDLRRPLTESEKEWSKIRALNVKNLRIAVRAALDGQEISKPDIILGNPPYTAVEVKSTEPVPVPAIHTMPQDIPVRGTARGDNDGKGDFTFNGETAGYVRRLPGLNGVKDAFALYVQGSSMSPWREEGGLVYVNPHRPARLGDHVVVEMRPTQDGEPGIVWIKKLVSRSPDGSLTLRQYNPPDDRIKLAGAKVLRVFRVMEWEELVS